MRPTTGQHGGVEGGSAPSTQHSGEFNLQDSPNLWNQVQQGHEGPAIDNQGNCIADCYDGQVLIRLYRAGWLAWNG